MVPKVAKACPSNVDGHADRYDWQDKDICRWSGARSGPRTRRLRGVRGGYEVRNGNLELGA